MVDVVALIRGAQLLAGAKGSSASPDLQPIVVEAVGRAAEGVTRVAAEAWLAAYEMDCIVRSVEANAMERTARTKAMIPVVMRRLEQVGAQQDRILEQLLDLQKHARGEELAHVHSLQRLLEHQTDSVHQLIIALMGV
jgi:hypothetical protein